MTLAGLHNLPLSRKQLDFIANSNSRLNLASGAIRAGKSIGALVRWLLYIASDAPTSGELVVVAKTTNTAASNVFLPLQDPDLFGDLAREVHYTRGAPSATILGRHVRVIGANDLRSEERLRGMTCAGALVDEITLVPNEFWTQLLGRMSVPGAMLFGSTNPGSSSHWLKRDFIDRINTGDLSGRHWHFTLDDNPSLRPEYKDAIKAEFAGLFFRRFVLGEWCVAEQAIYDMWDDTVHVVDDLPPIIQWVAVGVDYGTQNPLHAVLLGLGIDNVLYIVSEWRHDGRKTHRQLTDVEYSERLREWLKQPTPDLRDVQAQYFVVDPSAASFIAQAHRDGLNPWPAENGVIDGIRLMSSLLARNRLKIHRRCRELIAELPSYSWDERASERGEDRPVKVNDHGCDATRYAIATTEGMWRSRVLPAA